MNRDIVIIDLLSHLCCSIRVLIFGFALDNFRHGSKVVATIAARCSPVVQHIYLF
jgi:hypothetical protein